MLLYPQRSALVRVVMHKALGITCPPTSPGALSGMYGFAGSCLFCLHQVLEKQACATNGLVLSLLFHTSFMVCLSEGGYKSIHALSLQINLLTRIVYICS